MAVLGSTSKDAARDERDAWKRLQLDAGFATTAVTGLTGTAALAVGVTAAVTFAPMLAGAALVYWAQRKLVTIERKVEDPGRLVFTQGWEIRSPPLFTEVFGDTDLEEATSDFLVQVRLQVGLEDALILAGERREGALAVREYGWAEERGQDVERVADQLVRRAPELSTASQRLATALRAWEANLPFRESGPPPTPERVLDVLPAQLLVALFLMGASVDAYLFEPPEPADTSQPLSVVAQSVQSATAASRTFVAAVAEEWRGGPPSLRDAFTLKRDGAFDTTDPGRCLPSPHGRISRGAGAASQGVSRGSLSLHRGRTVAALPGVGRLGGPSSAHGSANLEAPIAG